ncbi:hypothetical protein Acr_13g0007850 [Actinidia rufa]|uniref:Uncharacterized protein n=1 Tax=Actinidia rufa TaxID=165716 RepID=A0A7J0FL01_9ERIC|nr:hypothetical protein Acr_13g0007850 [Actinidia rufa]
MMASASEDPAGRSRDEKKQRSDFHVTDEATRSAPRPMKWPLSFSVNGSSPKVRAMDPRSSLCSSQATNWPNFERVGQKSLTVLLLSPGICLSVQQFFRRLLEESGRGFVAGLRLKEPEPSQPAVQPRTCRTRAGFDELARVTRKRKRSEIEGGVVHGGGGFGAGGGGSVPTVGRSPSSYRYIASSQQSLPKTIVARAKTIVTFELYLFSKLRIITVLRLGCGATVDDNLEGCQETEGDLHVRVTLDRPHTRMETSAIDDGLPTRA